MADMRVVRKNCHEFDSPVTSGGPDSHDSMSKLFTFAGTMTGSYIGWWLGTPLGFMGSFALSMVGTGVGLYYGRRLAQNYQ